MADVFMRMFLECLTNDVLRCRRHTIALLLDLCVELLPRHAPRDKSLATDTTFGRSVLGRLVSKFLIADKIAVHFYRKHRPILCKEQQYIKIIESRKATRA